ncbi:MAG: bacillithiol biosynthesis BshC, partial [candidate division Zixibacteria bacterium]|nr:bacillithiol biosynthesis BshC [candidate division Zixibacteria bacterium]
MTELIAPSKSLGYTNLYLDFLAGRRSARHLYASSDIADTAARLDEITYDRERLVTILEGQNRSFGASQATMTNITRLRDNRALCVFAGRQACLFGGPLLILIKALAIVKIADRYSRQLGREVVPIFWIDADDHDFEEVN